MMIGDILEIQTSNEKELLLEWWTVDDLWFYILKKWRRGLWLTVNDRMQLTQQILEMLKSMAIIFQQSTFQYWWLFMDQDRIKEKGLLHRTWL